MLGPIRRRVKNPRFTATGKNLSISDMKIVRGITPGYAGFSSGAGGIHAAGIARDEETSLRKMPDR
jgi:hypothetical protein